MAGETAGPPSRGDPEAGLLVLIGVSWFARDEGPGAVFEDP
jgi:hypothetical protein